MANHYYLYIDKHMGKRKIEVEVVVGCDHEPHVQCIRRLSDELAKDPDLKVTFRRSHTDGNGRQIGYSRDFADAWERMQARRGEIIQ